MLILLRGESVLVDVQTISIVIAAVSVVIAVVNSILTNRRAESRRQMELKTRQVKFFFGSLE